MSRYVVNFERDLWKFLLSCEKLCLYENISMNNSSNNADDVREFFSSFPSSMMSYDMAH